MERSLLKRANEALQMRDFSTALELYLSISEPNQVLNKSIEFNIEFCRSALGSNGEIEVQPSLERTGSAAQPIVSTKSAKPKDAIVRYKILDHGNDDKLGLSSEKIIVVVNLSNYSDRVAARVKKIRSEINSSVRFIVLGDPSELSKQFDQSDGIQLFPYQNGYSSAHRLLEFAKNELPGTDYVCLINNTNYAQFEDSKDKAEIFTLHQIDQILYSEQHAAKIIKTFDHNPVLNIIGSADAYKSSTLLNSKEIFGISQKLKDMGQISLIRKKFGYFAGACVWMRSGVLTSIAAKLESLNDHDLANELTLEVLLSYNNLITSNNVGLLYQPDPYLVDATVIIASTTNISLGSIYTPEDTINAILNFDEDLLKVRGSIDADFYRKNYPYLSSICKSPEQHYLRYGAQEGFNPNREFSTEWNKCYLHKDLKIEDSIYNPYVYFIDSDIPSNRFFPAQENLVEITRIIAGTGLVDQNFYFSRNPDVATSRFSAVGHYSAHGWKEGRAPNVITVFDDLWYSTEHLRDWSAPISPILHYAIVGQFLKYSIHPIYKFFGPSSRLKRDQTVKRICLFAGYDSQGIIDEYVIDFVKELSRYSTVYYLADSEMSESELCKLQNHAAGAWAVRHGEYDFGSYARLALDLVGWSEIETCDELLLVNDSSYLLTDLASVFRKMDAKKCAWWGLQATKGIAATRNEPSNQYQEPIPLNHVLTKLIKQFERDDQYDFLIGSYFLAFRSASLTENGQLHNVLTSVKKERNKKNVILKYEIGLTRRMLADGKRPATFIDDLHTFHPVFSDNHFKLIREGFPLFKRYLLTENHYHVPQLNDWKARISAILPDCDLRNAEENLNRISSAEKLYRTLNVPRDASPWPEPLLSDEEFAAEDLITEKNDHTWIFPVCGFDHSFGGNERMIFELVKRIPSIKKIILYRSKNIAVDGVNVHSVPLKSRQGQKYLLQAGYIFIKHTPWRNTIYPLNPTLHRFINLWHGIPLKRIGYASLDMMDKLEASAKEHDKCHAVIASSKVDRLAMAAAFYPLTFHDVWVTGLPRNDAILMPQNELPDDFIKQIHKLESAIGDKRLVLYAPTFRNGQKASAYQFQPEELSELRSCLIRTNSVLGIREHMAARDETYLTLMRDVDIPIIDLNRANYADIELIYRRASMLITDYSSCFIDFMLTGKPQICFAYDYDSYASDERGLFYDIKDVFPGPVCASAFEVIDQMRLALEGHLIENTETYESKRSKFFDYIDSSNSSRVVDRIYSEISNKSPNRRLKHRAV